MSIYDGIQQEMLDLVQNLNLEKMSPNELKQTKVLFEKYLDVALYTKRLFSREGETEEEEEPEPTPLSSPEMKGEPKEEQKNESHPKPESETEKEPEREHDVLSGTVLEEETKSEVTETEIAEPVEIKQLFQKWSSDEKKQPSWEHYSLTRNLWGGTLNNGTITVSESTIRELGAQHGDIISAYFLERTNGKDRYSFELIEKKGMKKARGRNQLDRLIVQYDDTFRYYYLEKNEIGQELKYDGFAYRKVLTQGELAPMKLRVGDVVDYAWMDGKIDRGTILWKHEREESGKKGTEETAITIEHSVMVKKGPSKLAKKLLKQKKVEQTKQEKPAAIFEGKTICLIGGENSHGTFKQSVKDRGGDLLTLSGNEHNDTKAATILKSDCLIIALDYISHNASGLAVKTAKEAGIPFNSFRGFGKSKLIDTIKETLDAQVQHVVGGRV